MALTPKFLRNQAPHRSALSPLRGPPCAQHQQPAASFLRSPAASPPLPMILRTRPATPSSLAAPWVAFGVPRTREQLGRLSAIRMHRWRSEEHTSELQSRLHLVCRLLLEKKKKIHIAHMLYLTVATFTRYSTDLRHHNLLAS